jgi:hypothetical protein
MSSKSPSLKTYRVCVGHYDFRVRAHDADEAIAFARRQMAHELPQLYDVIRNLAMNCFRVESAA